MDEEGMVEFRLGIDHERWQQFCEACNIQAGRMLSPAEIETRAFYLWSDMIDKITEHYKEKGSAEPVILTIWVK